MKNRNYIKLIKDYSHSYLNIKDNAIRGGMICEIVEGCEVIRRGKGRRDFDPEIRKSR